MDNSYSKDEVIEILDIDEDEFWRLMQWHALYAEVDNKGQIRISEESLETRIRLQALEKALPEALIKRFGPDWKEKARKNNLENR